MNKKTCKIVAVIACVIALIGLISYAGGLRAVNPGVFLFPALISGLAFLAYKRK